MAVAALLIRLLDACYPSVLAPVVSRQLFRYAVCGGINMAADTFLYWLFYHGVVQGRYTDLGVVVLSPHIAAMLLVFPITFFNGFWLNRHVAFRSETRPAGGQLLRYGVSIGGSVLLTYAGLKCFVEVCGFWPTPSKLLTTGITVIYSFLAAKYFTFRK